MIDEKKLVEWIKTRINNEKTISCTGRRSEKSKTRTRAFESVIKKIKELSNEQG